METSGNDTNVRRSDRLMINNRLRKWWAYAELHYVHDGALLGLACGLTHWYYLDDYRGVKLIRLPRNASRM